MARAKTPRNGNTRTKQTANLTAVTAQRIKQGSSPLDLEAEIRRRAYELYEKRGGTPGHEDEDWFVAEREVLARRNHQPSA